MFQNVQDADTMLLHNVDTDNELNNLSQIQVGPVFNFSSLVFCRIPSCLFILFYLFYEKYYSPLQQVSPRPN